MTAYNLTGENPTDLPKRAIRALTEKMTVLPDTGRVNDADDLYLVVSESGSEYLVDAREGACDCPDARHNLAADDSCKHERRVRYATGETLIPEWTNADAIDPQLGTHTSTNPVRAAADGGIVAESDDDSPPLDASKRGECDNDWCDGSNGDSLPCFDCFEYMEGQ
ncbi:hypothetical protein PNP85_08865 [Halobacterium salinarum]|uniref:SWIM zinc finger domain protein n=1 Tax=Halobacterium salinarum (strain ATCC 33171 / DSM 3754 / JCM 8978 / NBRC 102687 / NCIMB 764 / 91-R6) TaxID=2597657 RepID=A0A4D6GU74_HALS9|nr:hypothetical protein [Halobacterium salinarum]MDL0139615.1 hypothetical protein [Halobacterium salinarum]QCC45400.1 SWIM zinc finger domain protein [Halobacterium salinarum]TYO81665.1 hypothetical protein APQ99_00173 [Halobacterium salinarum DSM 3754]